MPTDFNLEEVTLGHGGHMLREQGTCLMEAVAWMAGENHTDYPVCVDPVLGAFGRALNDSMSHGERQKLVPLIPKLIGTADNPAASMKRMYVLVDHALRVALPEILRRHKYVEQAAAFERLDRIIDRHTAYDAYKLAATLYHEVAHIYYSGDDGSNETVNAADHARQAALHASEVEFYPGKKWRAVATAVMVSRKSSTAVQAFQCAIGQDGNCDKEP